MVKKGEKLTAKQKASVSSGLKQYQRARAAWQKSMGYSSDVVVRPKAGTPEAKRIQEELKRYRSRKSKS